MLSGQMQSPQSFDSQSEFSRQMSPCEVLPPQPAALAAKKSSAQRALLAALAGITWAS
jgi:hypothetical protein